MLIHERYYVGLLITILFLMSACSPAIFQSRHLSGVQLLQNSMTVMSKLLKTVHVHVQDTVSLQTSLAVTPTAGTPTSSTSTTNGFGVTVNIDGDELLPYKASLKYSLGLDSLGSGNSNEGFTEIVSGDQVFIQNSKGRWYVLDANQLSGSDIVSLTRLPDVNMLLALSKHAKVIDHGDEKIDGQPLRHLSLILDKDGLRQFIEDDTLLASQSQLLASQAPNNPQVWKTNVDFWIDESTEYVHRLDMKLSASVDLSSLLQPTPGTTSTTPSSFGVSYDTLIDLSKFNEPVTITVPANAIPAADPNVIFGAGA